MNDWDQKKTELNQTTSPNWTRERGWERIRFQSLCRWCSKSLCVWLLKWIDTPLGCLHCTIHKGQTTSCLKSSDDLKIELDMISSCKLYDAWPICMLGLHQSCKSNTTLAAFWTEGKISLPKVINNQTDTLIWFGHPTGNLQLNI